MMITETDRLLLREFDLADGEAMDRVFGDAEVMRYGSGVHDSAWVRDWLPGRFGIYQSLGFGLWAVVEKSRRYVIGYCGLTHFPDVGGQPEIEIGYRLARAHWNRGYATEAARAVRDYAFDTLKRDRLISLIDPGNVASIHVAEKVGLQYEKDATLPGYTHSDRVYAMPRPGCCHPRS